MAPREMESIARQVSREEGIKLFKEFAANYRKLNEEPVSTPRMTLRESTTAGLKPSTDGTRQIGLGSFFVLVILFIFFFQPVLIDFFIEIFKKL